MERKLNLGSGSFRKEDYVNVDWSPLADCDLRHDLNEFPYPFADASFDLIEADHVLEHLAEPFQVMHELHRIGASGCRVRLRVPHFSRGFTHAGHRRGFDVSFPCYFDPTFPGGYQGVAFEKRRLRLHWAAQPYLKRRLMPLPLYALYRALGFLIDLAANCSPFLCSRIWCFWVGGFEELELQLVVRKEDKAS